ncbi:MAG: hypothetical protein ABI571_02345 [Actinomycetota bacterium]
MELRLTYDAVADIAYLVVAPTGRTNVLGDTLHLETDPRFAGRLWADYTTADGRLAGLEFFNASAILPAAWLVAAERIDGSERVDDRVEERIMRGLRAPELDKVVAERTH